MKKEMSEQIRKKPIKFCCCFCGKSVEKEICDITIGINKDKKKFINWQMFWCHKNCFKNRLHKIVKFDFMLGDKK